MKAMTMLNEGRKVESIALDLGYANSTAFINMFKRWMNLTPDQFRKI
jgi:AraC-like DNA-binding protein